MKASRVMFPVAAALVIAAVVAACAGRLTQHEGEPPIRVGANDIGGVVTSAQGPEAGVWVIAETTDLPTKFAKMVVTDDRGRYVMPELPRANYRVWVRGYGLIDSPKVATAPGRMLDLKAAIAPSAAAAAQYYPPIYWYSMLGIPAKSEFPAGEMKSQPEWLNQIKTTGCMSCHALGTQATRTMPKDFAHFKTSAEAWARRITSGQAMTQMVNVLSRLDQQRALALFGDWTDRIAAGELPFDQPSRPQGIERNVVITSWDWSTPTGYMHDLISTDRRKPTVNANGKLYGAPEESTDFIPVLDPIMHTATRLKHPVRDSKTPSSKTNPMAPSPIWGPEPIWDSQTSIHNQMMDEKGRVWMAARVRPPPNPAFCMKGSDHPSAKVFPLTA
ncbi:MAG: carboxypeptidase-like regulatory domain-containing protein, partial [Pseudomonadota bacterium]